GGGPAIHVLRDPAIDAHRSYRGTARLLESVCESAVAVARVLPGRGAPDQGGGARESESAGGRAGGARFRQEGLHGGTRHRRSKGVPAGTRRAALEGSAVDRDLHAAEVRVVRHG